MQSIVSGRRVGAIGLTIFFALLIGSYFSSQPIQMQIHKYVLPQGSSKPVTPSSEAGASFPSGANHVIASKKVAAIVETRPMSNLVPLIVHFASVLGPEWPIFIFTDSSITEFLSLPDVSAPFTRLRNSKQIQVITLPPEVVFTNSLEVSIFLTSSWVWDQLAPADHVLLFQSDSILCSKSEKRMEDFLEFDWIGAPLTPDWGEGFNGGLSLRNRNLMADVVQRWNFTEEYAYNLTQGGFDADATVITVGVEDQWYHRKFVELQRLGQQVKFPAFEVARGFAVENVWHDRPLGYHQIERWNKERLPEIYRWCPEWKLIQEGFFFEEGM